MTAIYQNGLPQNLEAAALDELAWLEFIERRTSDGAAIVIRNQQGLNDTIAALQKYVSIADILHVEDGHDDEAFQIITQSHMYLELT